MAKHPGGRPTEYKVSYNKQVEKLCKLGAIDKEIADFFNVNKATINRWKKKYPKFRDSLKKGKIEADMNVAESLYNKAMGYEKSGKYYPADITAIIYWSKNRRPKQWRDKQEIDLNINDYEKKAAKLRKILKNED